MRVRSPAAVACLALALSACNGTEETTRVAVGTRNLYLGAPIEMALAPGVDLYATVDTLWGMVQATNFPLRASALADEIAAHPPHLLGLQEVSLWRSQICDPPCGDGPWNPATHVEYDFLESLLSELSARGLSYTAVASVENFDGEFTGASGNDYRYTDRDVIIALQGVQIANPRGGNFTAALVVDVGGFPITITRGWVSVDATVDGKTFRFASAHLDDSDPVSQGEQAREFLTEVEGTLPLVAVGDFNSSPTETLRPAYGILLDPSTGLADTWTQLRPSETGPSSYSCCRDGLLSDPTAQLYERIDLVLHTAQLGPVSIDVTAGEGTAPVSGLWPSDHAGVFSVLEIQ